MSSVSAAVKLNTVVKNLPTVTNVKTINYTIHPFVFEDNDSIPMLKIAVGANPVANKDFSITIGLITGNIIWARGIMICPFINRINIVYNIAASNCDITTMINSYVHFRIIFF